MKSRRAIILTVVAAVLAGAALLVFRFARPGSPGAGLSDLVARADAAGFDVLLISLDTVRQDHLGCYGYAPAGTPAIDKLAQRGICFDDAVSSVPVTLPSHATLLTGLYPPRHGVRDNGLYRLAPDQVTLAERLRERGYATAAFVSCFVLDARFGLDQGFDVYDFQVTEEGARTQQPDFNERDAAAVTTASLGWLAKQSLERPYFLWVHYFDAHLTYRSPLAGEARFQGRPYDAEIAWVDVGVRRLIEAVERRGRLDKTLIVVVADHGESLGEHGEATHGLFVYESTVRVPFIISCSGLFERPYRCADRVVGLVDVAPTIADAVGVAWTGPCDGVSLLQEAGGEERDIYLETEVPLNLAGWSPLHALRAHETKFILAPESELYDLRADPGETRDLLDQQEARGETMRQRLDGMMQAMGSAQAGGRQLTREEIERLASLGYAHAAGLAKVAGPLPDPKVMLPQYQRSLDADAAFVRGDRAEAERLAAEVVAQCPDCEVAVRTLAFCRLREGQGAEAVALLREATARRPSVYLVRALAQAQIVHGDLGGARQTLETYARLDPLDGRVALLRGDILVAEGKREEARRAFEAALALDPNRTGPSARQRIARLNSRP